MDEGLLDSLKIGVEEIDAQHREFFQNLAALREALEAGAGGRDRMMKTLRYLEGYIDLHFRTEEQLMRRSNYPGILLHGREHEQFTTMFGELKKKVLDLDGRGELTAFIAVDVKRTLENWMTQHIAGTDKKFGQFLAARAR
jgi:hemerythrin